MENVQVHHGVLVAAVLAALTGCSVFGGDSVQEQFDEREQLPSCSTVELDLGQMLEERKSELTCLQDALDAGEQAELEVHYRTREGDPIISYYRVLADGSTEVYVDTTKDANSDQRWSFSSCAEPSSVLDVNC